MPNKKFFEHIADEGQFTTTQKTIFFKEIPWVQHPTFEGVQLKHILTAKETNGVCSYHLVQIAPHKSIGNHIHKNETETHEVIAGDGVCLTDTTEMKYQQGVCALLPCNLPHEVRAGENGLFLLAKFFPALL